MAAFVLIRQQRRAGLGQPHIGAALVQAEPAVGDGALKAGFIFRRRALELIQEGAVDLLNVDAPVLHGLNATRDLDELAGGGFRVGVGRSAAYFMASIDTLSRLVDQSGTPISPSRELGSPPARRYIKGGLIETVSRTTSAIGPEPIVPVPDGASADSASVLAARESEHQPPRPTRRKRLRPRGSAVGWL
jgi:hypothetical protein